MHNFKCVTGKATVSLLLLNLCSFKLELSIFLDTGIDARQAATLYLIQV